jgi:D-alanyl-D-alanine carboxypeptidase (penicillin-binding protein 5/6)
MLLDWGFGLPATASVGRLVTPEEAARRHSAPATTPAPAPTATAAATRPASATRAGAVVLFAVGLALVGVTGGLMIVVLRRQTRRARRS